MDEDVIVDDEIGKVNIPLHNLPPGQEVIKWAPIVSQEYRGRAGELGYKIYIQPDEKTPLAGGNYVFKTGNELTIFEKQATKLRWERTRFGPEKMDYQPCRPTYEMMRLRASETLSYGRRRMNETRKFKHEFPEKIKEMEARIKREEQEKEGGKKARLRWWQKRTAVELRDPLKMLRFNNLTFKPEELMSAKDIVFLQLTGCRLGDAGMSWISAFLQQSYTIKRLSLQANNITEEGCKELFLGVRTTKTLMELDLSMNDIGADGCATICNALAENSRYSRIYCVNLSSCKLGPAAAFHLARLIRDFKPLQSLLLWRNNLGLMTPMKVGAVSSILEELRSTTTLKLLNLTANVISDTDAAAHANAREVERRRRSQLEMDRKRQQARVEELQRKIREKRREAVWDDQRVQIATLEKELEQEKSRLRVSITLEQKSRTGAQKAELEYQARVKQASGAELVVPKVLPRLILTGNHSIRPQTLHRLAQFYDLGPVPNAPEFVNMPRRFDNVVASRRKLGEPYEGPRNIDEYDDFNVFPTYPFDPAADHARRTILLDWREEQRQAALNAVAVKFDKFAFKGPASPAPSKNAKMVVGGFKVASGVNDNIREVKKGQEAPKAEEAPKVRSLGTTDTKVVTKVVEAPKEVEVEVEVVKAPPRPTPLKSASDVGSSQANSPPKAAASSPLSSSNSNSKAKEVSSPLPPPKVQTIPRSHALDSSDEEEDDIEQFDFDGGTAVDDDASDLLSALVDVVEVDMQKKNDARLAELKAKLESKVKTTPRIEPAVLVVASTSAPPSPREPNSPVEPAPGQASVPISVPVVPPLAAQPSLDQLPPSGANSPKASSRRESVLVPSPKGSAPEVPALPLVADKPENKLMTEIVTEIQNRKSLIRTLCEKGSPSDEDLARIEREKQSLFTYKQQSAKKMLALTEAVIPTADQHNAFTEFLEQLIYESDSIPGNAELFRAFLSRVAMDYPTILDERGLVAVSACDGSMEYLRTMMAIPQIRFDIMDLLSSCFFNQTLRIPLALEILKHHPQVFDLATVADELQPTWQEFFEDVASTKRAMPREDRTGRLQLVERMLSLKDVVPLDIESDGNDGRSILIRAAAEGDLEVMTLLLQHCEVQNVNEPKLAGLTVFLAAVIGNNLEVIKLLQGKFPTLDLQVVSENGNAMDLATSLGRDKKIVDWLKANGVKATGKAPKAKPGAKASGKKAPVAKATRPPSRSPAPKKK
jgi:hypothetical protein